MRNEITQQRQHRKEPFIADFDRRMPLGVFVTPRNSWFYAEHPVPEATMVGADIAHLVEAMEPGIKDLSRYTIYRRDVALDLSFGSPEESEKHPERHEFHGHP